MTAYVFLAEGFEEVEALTPVDILRRGGVTVKTVGIGGKTITGAHGIPVGCDIAEEDVIPDEIDMMVLPGGMPGTTHLGESLTIVSLDTLVAIMSGLIIFPACFTYNNGVTADAGSVGSSFLFTTLSSIFNTMPAGRIIGSLFFLFMIFASFSTVIGVFENIMSFWIELTKFSRKQIAAINICLVFVLSLPAVLGNNMWSFIQIGGKSLMDLEDFVISNNVLPLGSFFYVIFCTYNKHGWGWSNFIKEVNTGEKKITIYEPKQAVEMFHALMAVAEEEEE